MTKIGFRFEPYVANDKLLHGPTCLSILISSEEMFEQVRSIAIFVWFDFCSSAFQSSSPQPPYAPAPFMVMHPPSYHQHQRHHHPNPPVNCNSGWFPQVRHWFHLFFYFDKSEVHERLLTQVCSHKGYTYRVMQATKN